MNVIHRRFLLRTLTLVSSAVFERSGGAYPGFPAFPVRASTSVDFPTPEIPVTTIRASRPQKRSLAVR